MFVVLWLDNIQHSKELKRLHEKELSPREDGLNLPGQLDLI